MFFSVNYADRSDLFKDLNIWKNKKYRELQGTIPVISLSFANVKEDTYEKTKVRICQTIVDLYIKYAFLRDSDALTEKDREYFDRVSEKMEDTDAVIAFYKLSDFMQRYYGQKPIILLDEYDTPMQEAYVNGYWNKMVLFTRSLFNSTFKTNPYFNRAVMTGITRVSRESIFSDLNKIVELSDKYTITSNRESGFGRYDVMLEPKTKKEDAIIIEFKVHRSKKEKDLEDMVLRLRQKTC